MDESTCECVYAWMCTVSDPFKRDGFGFCTHWEFDDLSESQRLSHCK